MGQRLSNLGDGLTRWLLGATFALASTLLIFQFVFFSFGNWEQVINAASFKEFATAKRLAVVLEGEEVDETSTAILGAVLDQMDNLEELMREVVLLEAKELLDFMNRDTDEYVFAIDIRPIKDKLPQPELASFVPDEIGEEQLFGPSQDIAQLAEDQLLQIRDSSWLYSRLLLVMAIVLLLLRLILTSQPRRLAFSRDLRALATSQFGTTLVWGGIYGFGWYWLIEKDFPGSYLLPVVLNSFVVEMLVISASLMIGLFILSMLFKWGLPKKEAVKIPQEVTNGRGSRI